MGRQLFRVFGSLPHYARQCYRRARNGGWVEKQAYPTKADAERRCTETTHAYKCVYHGWHVGHERNRRTD